MQKRRKTLIFAGVALATHLSFAIRLHAFSVGDIEVHSHLGVPFVSEVPLVMQPHERNESLVAVIGDAEEYENEGSTRPPVVDQLRPVVIMGPPDKIYIVSDEPIQASAFDIVLLVRAGSATIVRHFPIVVPPALSPAPVASAPARAPKAQPQSASVVVPISPTQQDTAPVLAKSAWLQRLPHMYGPVRPGQTLYRVMEELEIPKAAVWPVAVRIWQANRLQFSGGNMHGLMSGAYLHFPSELEQAIATLDMWDAQRVVAEQWEAWQALQQVGLAPHSDAPLPQVNVDGTMSLAAEASKTSASTVMIPGQQVAASISVTELQSVLKGFEERLAQRLTLPLVPSGKQDETTIPLVSTTELQNSLQGLESRLVEKIEHTVLPQAQLDGGQVFLPSKQTVPALTEMQTLVTPRLSTETILYVLVGQNLLLFLLAVGFAWGWYRSRKQVAVGTPTYPPTRPTRFISIANDPAT
jgi:Tfp pilus assembly protein FimV